MSAYFVASEACIVPGEARFAIRQAYIIPMYGTSNAMQVCGALQARPAGKRHEPRQNRNTA